MGEDERKVTVPSSHLHLR